jgi:hypothetical protein
MRGLRRTYYFMARKIPPVMDWPHGCIAVTDSEMEEIWCGARRDTYRHQTLVGLL